jgi:hypothetical protein
MTKKPQPNIQSVLADVAATWIANRDRALASLRHLREWRSVADPLDEELPEFDRAIEVLGEISRGPEEPGKLVADLEERLSARLETRDGVVVDVETRVYTAILIAEFNRLTRKREFGSLESKEEESLYSKVDTTSSKLMRLVQP